MSSPIAISSSSLSPGYTDTDNANALPPRSTSPPLGPRKNIQGLPPTYLGHLRRLLRQWLEQQVDDTLPSSNIEGNRLWSDEKIVKLENAIWNGAVVPHEPKRGKALLELEWDQWAAKAARRKDAWRMALAKEKGEAATQTEFGKNTKVSTGREVPSRKTTASLNDDKGRLTVPSSPLQIPSSPRISSASTPTKALTRTSSVASSSRTPIPSDGIESFNQSRTGKAKEKENREDEEDEEEQLREWCRIISCLKGFERFSMPKKDEWEVVNDDLPKHHTITRDIPGAFPQSSNYDYRQRLSMDLESVPVVSSSLACTNIAGPSSANGLDISEMEMVKAVFCVHFPASTPVADGSASTLRLRRDHSLSARSNGSNGSGSGRGWWGGSGSGAKWNELTAGPDTKPEEVIVVEYAEGRFALPSISTTKERIGHRGRSKLSIRQRKSVLDAFGVSPTPSSTIDDNDTEAGETGDDISVGEDINDDEKASSSSWSGTERGTNQTRESALSLMISGADDDLPRTEVEDGEVAIVGGTLFIRGITKQDERDAVKKVLQLLIYTIQTMMLELELLDAFRIPREAGQPPLPPKPVHGTVPVPHSPSRQRDSTDLQRKNPQKERGERTKGFFLRLGKESRGVWEGLLGKRRTSTTHDQDQSSPTATDFDLPRTLPTPLLPSIMDQDVSKSGELTSGLPAQRPGAGAAHPTEKHLQILARLERLAHSTTPGLVLPLPPLLLRVREEDRTRREKAKLELSEEKTATPSGLPTTTTSLLGLTITRDASSSPIVDPLRGRALAYRLGGDIRSGLGALAFGADTLEGWIRLQSLETLYSIGLEINEGSETEKTMIICQKPIPETFVFWDKERDRSIEGYMRDLTSASMDGTMVCPRSGCAAENHNRWWIHAGKRVALKIHDQSFGDLQDRQEVDVWAKCDECGKCSQPRNLSDAAKSYSWGKLLELLLYTRLLVPSFCPHTTPSPDRSSDARMSYLLRSAKIVLSLSVESVSVLDTRLPKLQVGPNVSKRKSGKEAAVTALEGLAKREVREERFDDVKREIRDFYASFHKRINLLVQHQEVKRAESKEEHQESDTESKGSGISTQDGLESLDALHTKVKQAEIDLQANLISTPTSQLNDIRRLLTQQVKSATGHLHTWQKDHAIDAPNIFQDSSLVLPEYMDTKVHALPGSAVLFREDEPSSLIAYTLSSLAYFNELTSNGNTIKIEGTPAVVSSDDEAPGGIETWLAELKRKDTPRDLLSLRTLAKKRSDATIALPSKKLPVSLTPTPNTPSLELSLEQVEGKSQTSDRLGDLARTIGRATAADTVWSGTATPKTTRSFSSTSLSISESEIGNGLSPSARSWLPQAHPPGKRSIKDFNSKEATSTAPPPSAFRRPTRSVSANAVPSSPSSSTGLTSPNMTNSSKEREKEGWGSVTSSFSNSFNHLLKIGTEVGESLGSIRAKGTERASVLSSLIGPLSKMSNMDGSLNSSTNIDDRPHLQFSYTLGDRLKLRCTVYYASSFDSLRRRCAIDRSLITSLERTNDWNAEGGKSKASFFMTRDKRYIVKELVSKWNVSDTHALLEIAPAYFEHLASTHNKATSLAKIVGFYTVRINDIQTGTNKQLDLLVMENLFYKQTISRTYDLKGIEGRKVVKVKNKEGKEGSNPKISKTGTMFDGEWLEGMQRDMILVQPHAKRILVEAISLDTKFLSSQSIMDYSLLLGVDENKNELVAGLVDAIGSYGLFKTIESRGKMVINRGGEVTVIPPDQYRERFESALKQYFIACPDKWSKGSKRISSTSRNQNGIPSVM